MTSFNARFRGRFEQLEARMVLSATMSELPENYEIVGEATVYLPAPPPPDGYFHEALKTIEPDTGVAYAFDERPDLFTDAGYHQPEQVGRHIVIVVSYRPPQLARAGQRDPAVNEPAPDFPPPLDSKAPSNGWEAPYESLAASSLAPAANALWLSNETTSYLTSSTLDSQDSIDLRDHAFQEYWSEAIMPAATPDGSDDNFEMFDDMTTFEEEDDESANAHELREGEATSLGELFDRELKAIDSVLSKLHDFKFHEPEATASRKERDKEPDLAPDNNVALLLSTRQAQSERQPVDLAEGGMVLLEADSDLDESLDLTAVFAKGMERKSAEPLGVEVTMGIYQAFDVGTANVVPARSTYPDSRDELGRERAVQEQAHSESAKQPS